jgi:hypothetical protein
MSAAEFGRRLRGSVKVYGPRSWRVGPIAVMENQLEIGPIVVLTRKTAAADEHAAFALGRDYGRSIEHQRADDELKRRGLPPLLPTSASVKVAVDAEPRADLRVVSAVETCPAWCTSAHDDPHAEPGDHLRPLTALNDLDGVDLVATDEGGVEVSVWVGGNDGPRLDVDEAPARLRALATMFHTAADELERLDPAGVPGGLA